MLRFDALAIVLFFQLVRLFPRTFHQNPVQRGYRKVVIAERVLGEMRDSHLILLEARPRSLLTALQPAANLSRWKQVLNRGRSRTRLDRFDQLSRIRRD